MKHAIIAVGLFITTGLYAQNVGIGTISPNLNAKLDITATDKGLLIPRMDSVHRKSIPNTIGLLVYDSTTKSFWYNDGSAWQNMAAGASGWSLAGNSGTDTSINFLGTNDDKSLVFKVNNQFAGRIGHSELSLGAGSFTGSSTGVTAIGFSALHSSSGTGSFDNTALGTATLANSITGSGNTALGAYALNSCIICQGNTATGASSMLKNETGNNNNAYGKSSLRNNTTGSYNASIGGESLISNTSGNYNTAVGGSAAQNSNTDGTTAIGYKSLANNFYGINNTGLGYNSDLAFLGIPLINNATAIGANAKVDASNKIRLGDANVTVVESNGAFNTVSDGRFKYNIREDVKGLAFIMQLRPVTYLFDAKKQEDFTKGIITPEQLNSRVFPAGYNETSGAKRTGFIAQEVAAAAKKLDYDFDGVKIPANEKQYYSLSYASFVVPLVKAVQEQEQTITALKTQNELLRQQNEIIIKRLEALEKK